MKLYMSLTSYIVYTHQSASSQKYPSSPSPPKPKIIQNYTIVKSLMQSHMFIPYLPHPSMPLVPFHIHPADKISDPQPPVTLSAPAHVIPLRSCSCFAPHHSTTAELGSSTTEPAQSARPRPWQDRRSKVVSSFCANLYCTVL